MHAGVDDGAEDDVDIVGEEAPDEHSPEDVAGGEGGEYHEESTFGGARVAWSGDEIDGGGDCDGGDKAGEKIDFAAKCSKNEKRNH